MRRILGVSIFFLGGVLSSVSNAGEPSPPKKLPIAQVPVAQVPVAQVPVAQVPVAQVPVAQVPDAQVPVAQVPDAQVTSELMTDAARIKGEEGLLLFSQARWREAYEAFRLAEELFHAPTLVMRMARCQSELGQLRRARDLARTVASESLQSGSSAAYLGARTDAVEMVAALEKRLAHVRLVVTGVPVEKVTLKLDDVAVKADGATLELEPGAHRLEGRAPGAESRDVRFTLSEGADEAVPIAFTLLREKVVVVMKEAPPAVGRAPGFITLGLGLASLAVGGVAGGMVLQRVAQLEQSCGGFVCPSSLVGESESAARLATASTVGFVAGGVGVAVSAIFFTLHFRSPPAAAERSARLGVTVTPSGGQLVFQW